MAITKMTTCKKLLITLGLILAIAVMQPASVFAASTYYTPTNYTLLGTTRWKITTSLYSYSTSVGAKSIVLKAVNSTKVPQNFKYSYSCTKSGAVSLGSGIPITAINLAVGMTARYSSTTTVSTSITVPPKTTYYVYKSQGTSTKKYKSLLVFQIKGITIRNGKVVVVWDSGKPSTRYSTWTQKYPIITVSK